MYKFLSFLFIALMFNLNASVVQAAPELSIPLGVPADAGQKVTLPVTFTANGDQIGAIFFSVDFDEANLRFDDTNTTGLPWPDSITVNPAISPFVFSIGFSYEPADTDGELDFTFSDVTQPLSALPEGGLVTITFTAGDSTVEAPIKFSLDPAASFGNTAGASVAGTTVDGSVSITGAGCTSDTQCDDGVSCTVDTCDLGTGLCSNAAADGLCDNGQFCDGVETCDAVNDCQAGTPVDCADGVGCTVDSCNEGTDACDNVADDGFCDNGQFCDGVETCDPVNDCVGGSAPCNPDTEVCDENQDICAPAPDCVTDGDCNDQAFCNGVETCVAGTCQAGTPVNCDDGVGCTVDACDESTDSCDHVADDGLCDNGQFCDGVETCEPVSDCQAGTDPCAAGETCNEANDVCEVPAECATDADCNDDVFCNGVETCDASGNCQPGTPVDCDDGVGCTVDSCNEGTDTCDNAADDGFCDNGLFCDGVETCDPVNDCVAGAVPCNPDTEVCDEIQDLCVPAPDCVTDDDCNDQAFCNGVETCVAGTCQAGTPVNCDDGVSCTVDSCNEGSDSCDHVADDGLCDNGQFCDGVETCDAIHDCQVGIPPSVDDGVDCTANDLCAVPTECTIDADCDDGAFCNGVETCVAGTCQAGTPINCDDGVSCTVDSCNEGSDSCDNVPDDGLCDNGQFCDGSETCDAIHDCQAGTPLHVDDGVDCTDDRCDEVNDAIVNTPMGIYCDDGAFCNGSETCDPINDCQGGKSPCGAGETCDEAMDSCGSPDGGTPPPSGPPADHTIKEGGFMHKRGLEHPFTNRCTACHGKDLTGDFAPSCYSCHGKEWDEKGPGYDDDSSDDDSRDNDHYNYYDRDWYKSR